MLTPDQRDNLAKAGAVQVDQPLAVAVLFDRHAIEHCRRGREIGPQAFGEGPVDAGVVLFRGDRQRQDLLF